MVDSTYHKSEYVGPRRGQACAPLQPQASSAGGPHARGPAARGALALPPGPRRNLPSAGEAVAAHNVAHRHHRGDRPAHRPTARAKASRHVCRKADGAPTRGRPPLSSPAAPVGPQRLEQTISAEITAQTKKSKKWHFTEFSKGSAKKFQKTKSWVMKRTRLGSLPCDDGQDGKTGRGLGVCVCS